MLETLFTITRFSSEHTSEHNTSLKRKVAGTIPILFAKEVKRRDHFSIKDTVSVLFYKTLSENQLCILIFFIFFFPKYKLSF